MDRAVRPERFALVEHNAGEWPTVGVVDQKGDFSLCGEFCEAAQLKVRNQIPARIRGPGDTDRAGFGRGIEFFKIDVIFECVRPGFFDERAEGLEYSAFQRLVRIADIFRHERKKDFSLLAIRALPAEEIEEQKECGLPAWRDGNIFRSDRPSVFLPEKFRQPSDAIGISARRIVNGEGAAECRGIADNFFHTPAPDFLHGRNVRRVSTSEHVHRGARCGQRVAKVIHQLLNAAAACQHPSTG